MFSALFGIAALLILKTATDVFLDTLNAAHVAARKGAVPDAYQGSFDLPTYNRAADYTLAGLRVGRVETIYDAVILAVLLFSGILPWAYTQLTMHVFGSGLVGQAAVLFVLLIVLSLPSLPFEWWKQFRLEEEFGFNKSTLGLWVSDKLKGLAIGFVLGFPLLIALLWFFDTLPLWWLWAWAALFLFQLLLLILWPRFILPLFNKLEPLPAGELRQRLLDLAQRTGFQASNIEVIDGSKRSGHSNAFFTGFGRFRRIVLYDTLIEQLTTRELEAVLAHEIGHYKLGHIPRMLLVSALSSLVGFAILGYLSSLPAFYSLFGFTIGDGMVPALLLFMLLSGLFTFWLSPLMNLASRRHEYQADRFARDAMGDATPLIDSLRKLHRKNLSNLTPHPLYSFFHYSHPTLPERERNLKSLS